MDPVFFINDGSGYGHIADIQDYGDLFNTGDAVGGIFHPADGRRQWRRRERECRIIQKYKQTYIRVVEQKMENYAGDTDWGGRFVGA